MDGTQGGQAQDCINFMKNFADFEVVFEDEDLHPSRQKKTYVSAKSISERIKAWSTLKARV